MRKELQIALVCLSCLVPSIVLAQSLELGNRLPIDPEATEVAGIGFYSLTRDGDVAGAEVFDTAGVRLAACEVGLAAELRSITCGMDGGNTFRLTLTEGGSDFEDLITGDSISSRWVSESAPAESLSALPWQHPEGLAETPAGLRPSLSGRWVVEGTKSQAEADLAWGKILPVLAYTLADIEEVFGSWQRMLDEGGAGGLESAPQGLVLNCPGGASPTCDTGSGTFNQVTITSGSTHSACCTAASTFADTGCRIATGVNCCANSFCTSDCSGGSCTCTVKGYFFVCPHCD